MLWENTLLGRFFENHFFLLKEQHRMCISGSPVCAFYWQMPFGFVTFGCVSGDKAGREQMALIRWAIWVSPVLRLSFSCLGCVCVLLPPNPTGMHQLFSPFADDLYSKISLTQGMCFPDGCLYFFLSHFRCDANSSDELK